MMPLNIIILLSQSPDNNFCMVNKQWAKLQIILLNLFYYPSHCKATLNSHFMNSHSHWYERLKVSQKCPVLLKASSLFCLFPSYLFYTKWLESNNLSSINHWNLIIKIIQLLFHSPSCFSIAVATGVFPGVPNMLGLEECPAQFLGKIPLAVSKLLSN